VVKKEEEDGDDNDRERGRRIREAFARTKRTKREEPSGIWATSFPPPESISGRFLTFFSLNRSRWHADRLVSLARVLLPRRRLCPSFLSSLLRSLVVSSEEMYRLRFCVDFRASPTSFRNEVGGFLRSSFSVIYVIRVLRAYSRSSSAVLPGSLYPILLVSRSGWKSFHPARRCPFRNPATDLIAMKRDRKAALLSSWAISSEIRYRLVRMYSLLIVFLRACQKVFVLRKARRKLFFSLRLDFRSIRVNAYWGFSNIFYVRFFRIFCIFIILSIIYIYHD